MEIARPRDNATLARALDGEVLAAEDPSLRAWVRRTTRGLIVAPVHAEDHTAGVLVFGRWRDARTEDDLEMAGVCAEFIGRFVTAEARSADGFLQGLDFAGRHTDDARLADRDRL